MKTKLISLLLVVAMMVTMFAVTGCSKAPAEETTAPEVADTTAAGDAETTEAPEETINPDDLVEVKVLCKTNYANKNRFDRVSEHPDFEEAPRVQEFYKELAEDGVKLAYEAIDNEQYDQAVKTRLMTGVELPDIILDPHLTDVEALNLGKSGVAANVMELLEKYDEDGSIKKYWEDVTGGWLSTISTEDGKCYWITCTFRNQFIDEKGNVLPRRFESAHAVSIREDWLNNVGLEWKMFWTPDELADALIKMNQEDANGNGVKDEVLGNFRVDFKTGFEPGFGMVSRKWIGVSSNGEGVLCNLYAEGFPDYIRFLQKLYQGGAIDITALNGTNIMGANRGSTLCSYASQQWEEQAIPGYESTAVYSPIIVDDDNGENGFTMPFGDNMVMLNGRWFINGHSEHPEAIVKVLDHVYNEKFAEACTYGNEGVHFEYNENGVRIPLDSGRETNPENPDPLKVAIPRSLGGNAVPYAYDMQRIVEKKIDKNPAYQHKEDFEWYMAQHDTPEEMILEELLPPYAMATDEEIETLNKYESDLKTYVDELMLGLITGEKSLDDYPTYLEELKALGLDEYVAVYEARYQRFLDAAHAMGQTTIYDKK